MYLSKAEQAYFDTLARLIADTLASVPDDTDQPEQEDDIPL
jgi:hypothetical protein